MFRKAVVMNKRRAKAGYISVRKSVEGFTEIVVHQDGGSRGPGQTSPAKFAPRTIVGTSNTSVTPTILAARREMQQWRFLALEPSAMRCPDRFQAASSITVSGGHVPATLNRLAAEAENRGGDADEVFGDIALRIAELVPVVDLEVEIDDARQLLTLVVQEQSGIKLPATSLSDGTLRFLTLAVLATDPDIQGLICIEEPANGIHPAKMPQMVNLLQGLAVDASRAPGADNPFRQVIIATHSPWFVQLQKPRDVLFATESFVSRQKRAVRTLRCKPLEGTWRARFTNEPPIGFARIQAYLASPPEAQIGLFNYAFEPLHK